MPKAEQPEGGSAWTAGARTLRITSSWLYRMSLSGRIATNTGVQVAGQAISVAVAVLLAAVLSRYLGPAGYGDYSLALAYVALLTGLFADWGLGTIVVKELALHQEEEQTGVLLTNGTLLQAAVAVGAYLLLILSLPFAGLRPPVAFAALLWGLTILLTPIDILGKLFQARLELHFIVAAGVIGKTLTLLLVALSAAWGAPLSTIILGSLIGTAGQYALTFALLHHRLNLRWRPQPQIWSRLIRQSWPLGISATFVVAINQVPLLALGQFGDPAQTGLYAAAFRLVGPLLFAPTALAATIYPLMARYIAEDPQALRQVVQRSLGSMLLLGVTLAMGVNLLADPLVRSIFGPRFAPGADILRVLIWMPALLCPGIIAGNLLIARGLQRWNMTILGVAVLVQALGMTIIPRPLNAHDVAATVSLSYVFITMATMVIALLYIPDIRPRGLVSLLHSVGLQRGSS